MARVEQSYPTPIQGISTLAPRNRGKGHAALQENMRSDPVAKLTRRPSLTWDAHLLTTMNPTAHHSYYRDGKNFSVIVEDTGAIHGYVDTVKKPVTGTLGTYGTSADLRLKTINDTTFVVNPNVVTQPSVVSQTARKVVHVNVTNALSYSTTLTLTMTFAQGLFPTILANIVTGDGSNPLVHDAARATNQVAADIATQANTVGGVIAVAEGSSVAIELDTNVWPEIEVSSGRTDDVVAINRVVASPEGLPLHAIPDTVITVQPDPAQSEGTYYLKSTRLVDGWGSQMQEVVWRESVGIDQIDGINAATMPHLITYDTDTDTFIVSEGAWNNRQVGDDESVPPPAFLRRKINALGQFQKRLVLVSENNVSMSRTDDLFNWWKKSTLTLLATDPIEIASNSPDTDLLQHIVEHNRDLLLIASNGQFKIDGTVGVTPQTVALPLTTTQEIQISVPPIPLGTSVYLPINYGQSTGMTKYDGNRDQQDIAQPITHHVIGYMLGTAKVLAGSPNLEMLAMTTENALGNEVFVYEQFTDSGEALQRSWSKWTLPVGNVVLALNFRRDQLTATVKVGNEIIQKSLNMYSRVATNTHEVFLDDFLTLPTTGLTATLPSTYTTPNMVVVMGDGTAFPLMEVPHTLAGSTITFAEDIGAGEVYVGSPFTSSYEPTRPFVQDQEGIAVTSDRLRVASLTLNVVNTEEVKMHINSEYYSIPDQVQSPRIMGALTNQLGVVNLYTGDYRFSYAQDADLATATFYTDGYLGMTIAGISWAGQYNKSSKRL